MSFRSTVLQRRHRIETGRHVISLEYIFMGCSIREGRRAVLICIKFGLTGV